MYLADTADIVVGNVPSPNSHRIPFLDSDFHLDMDEYCCSWYGVITDLLKLSELSCVWIVVVEVAKGR